MGLMMMEPGEQLSEREIEILQLVATGASNKEIAVALSISPNTVKVHLRNIFAKIGVLSRTEATLHAIKVGIVAQPGQPSVDAAQSIDPPNAASPAALASLDRIAHERASRRSMRSPLTLSLLGIVLVLLVGVLIAPGILGDGFAANPTTQTPPIAVTVAPRWQYLDDLPVKIDGMASVAYQGRILLIGGETENGITGLVLAFDPANSQWVEAASKPTQVRDVQAAMLGEKVYVPGGATALGTLATVTEVYDPREDRWETTAELPEGLSAYALVAYEGDLYLFGGWNGSAYNSNVYRYVPGDDRWESRSNLPEGRGYAAAVVQEGRILIIGGRSSLGELDSVLAYYPSRDDAGEDPWEDAPSLPEPRASFAATALANSVYVVGGKTSSTENLSPIVLSASAPAWEPFEMPAQASGSGGALVPLGNYLHAIGGSQTTGESILRSEAHLVYQALYTVAIPLLSNDPSTNAGEATVIPTP